MQGKDYSIIAVADNIDKLNQEFCSAALGLSELIGGDPLIVVTGISMNDKIKDFSENFGIDFILLKWNEIVSNNHDVMVPFLVDLVHAHKSAIVLFEHTSSGCAIAPRVAVSIGASCISAVEGYETIENELIFIRSFFNGKLSGKCRFNTKKGVVTILPGAFPVLENNRKKGDVRVIDLEESIGNFKIIRSYRSNEQSGINLDEADVIVSAGRGVGSYENLPLIQDLAGIFKSSAIACSRPVCDMDWLPYAHQVGSTGKTVSPGLYIACGISGAQQHLIGMRQSGMIVAINSDPNAAIFSYADYCIVEDLEKFIPVLLELYCNTE